MIGRRSEDPIDVEDELAAREAARAEGARAEGEAEVEDRIEGERGPFSAGVRRQAAPGSKAFFIVVLAFVAIFAVVFISRAFTVTNAPAEPVNDMAKVRNPNPGFTPAEVAGAGDPAPEVPQNMVVGPDGQLVPALLDAEGRPVIGPNGEVVPAIDGSVPLMPVGAEPGTAVATAQPQPGAGGTGGTRPISRAEALRLRRLGGDFGSGNGGGSVQAVAAQAGAGEAGGQAGGGGNELQSALRPLQITPERAGQLGNRDLLLTRGAMLDCVLETKIVSTVPGMTSCYLTRDIYSASGRVVLLDRGSKVVGFYQGGLRQGQSRIFVQWSRVETPKGVIINVDSPGTGPLGEGGVGGQVDNHFMQRFGAAILLSVVDSVGQYAANQGSGGTNIRFGGNSDQITDTTGRVLENTINIPPTLYKNQGDRISVYVARDLDFRGVYDLKRR